MFYMCESTNKNVLLVRNKDQTHANKMMGFLTRSEIRCFICVRTWSFWDGECLNFGFLSLRYGERDTVMSISSGCIDDIVMSISSGCHIQH